MCYGMGTQGNGAYFSLLRQRKGGQKKGCFLNTGFGLLAGLRLPRASLFFASPKKSKQKKGEPKAVALRATLRYSRRPGSGANSLRSNKRPP